MNAKFQNKGEKDLFGQFETADEQIRQKTKLLLPNVKRSLILSYENVIFLAIGFVMVCVIFFTLGVEKGKRCAAPIRNKAVFEERELLSRTQDKPQLLRQGLATQFEGYVVQLAAFKGTESAEQERSELKKIGYLANIKQSGDYYQLYIGAFKTKKEADGVANRLRHKYADCYVKRVESSVPFTSFGYGASREQKD